MTHDHILRPNCPRAHSITTCTCGDPECGLHMIAWRDDTDRHPLCEIVIGRDQIRGLLQMIHEQGLDLP